MPNPPQQVVSPPAGKRTQPVVTGFDMPSLLSVLQPMTQSIAGRIPLLAWTLPIPFSESIAQARADGKLLQYVQQMAARGIVPVVQIGPAGSWHTGPIEELALASTLQEAGLPVYLQFNGNIIESTAWQNNTVWSVGPDAAQGGKVRRWPCLPLADGTIGARSISQQLLPLQQAGIKVAGVWFDDEGLPGPWNGIYESQKANARCAAYYPSGVLNSWDTFAAYAYSLRSRLETQVMADPVHALFPGALVGNFADAVSTVSSPYLGLGKHPMPAYDLGGMDTMMPMLYPQFLWLAANTPQQQLDATMFERLLAAESSAASNRGSKRIIPFLSIYAVAPYGKGGIMSSAAGKELMRQMFLRGMDGMYLFNLNSTAYVTDEQSLQFLEDARSVYDQMLAFPEFLDHGTPMNLATPNIIGGAAVWSGLKIDDKALVSAWSPTGATQQVKIQPFAGVTITLAAPSQGATYIVGADGRVQQVST